ncbi:Metallo-dependent phosphatase-like protein [Pisolithus orientalis]|uniref:Metallo-dependent phosphatase-like protein n=1 Tax=Pisolithus orientalis TaxID=936130 RepID=UPI002224167E|nr:Metallo-dependent phosphatase-like protein [Pisolithus orientalis]KAI6010736.1 Metallo-dependent phosphatase-like protein [Pisolithus orientalis]
MALSCSRFFRFLRSIAEPVLAIVGFSCLLTFIFILYQPTPGPGISQKVGWQSWDSVSSVGNSTTPEDVSVDTDWWNVSYPGDEPSDTSSYPLDYWAPFLPHDTGLSEITIERCMFSPEFAGIDLCAPETTVEKDAVKGKWVRVERDLNMQSGLWSLNLYYRRTRRLDVPLITEFKLLPSGEEPGTRTDMWFKVKRSIRDGVVRQKPLYLWYKIGKAMNEMTTEEKQQIITEVDVLFGEDRPWYGFEKVEPAVTPEKDGVIESVYVTYRRGVKPVPHAPPLHFSQDGKFKILQVADLHFSVSRGECRDTDISPCYASDNLTSTLLGHVLDAEKPDMVVFTGDQLNGQGTSWDPKSVLAKFASEVIDRSIPWAAVFGNHDDENGAVRAEQLKMMQALPYSLVERGPKDIHGVGNYVLKVRSGDSSATHLLTLYFIDSGAYSQGYFDWFGYFFPTEYDWIHQDQIDWFLGESALIYPIERPYTPQTTSDLGDIWRRQSDQLPPTTRKLAKPNALMFFHIPLQESYGTPDIDQRTGLPLDIGTSLEGSGAAKKSDGMFEKGLLAALETDHRSGAAIPEVKAVANGHCHVIEDCKRIKDVWLCFGGGGSYSGYGRVGFDRRFRVYEISDYGETIRTYKRSEHDEILNDYILAGQGAAPYNSQWK